MREAQAAGQLELFVLPSFPVLVPALAVLEGTGVRVGAQTVSVPAASAIWLSERVPTGPRSG